MVSDAFAQAEKVGLFTDLLHRMGEARIRVTGSSMLPAIWPGDILTIRRCRMADACAGDIALFTRDGRLFAHRVVGRGNERLVTRGDTVPTADGPVSDAEFLGIVVSVVRDGNRVGSVDSLARRSVTGRLVAAAVRRSSTASRMLQRGRALRARLGVS